MSTSFRQLAEETMSPESIERANHVAALTARLTALEAARDEAIRHLESAASSVGQREKMVARIHSALAALSPAALASEGP